MTHKWTITTSAYVVYRNSSPDEYKAERLLWGRIHPMTNCEILGSFSSHQEALKFSAKTKGTCFLGKDRGNGEILHYMTKEGQ